MAAPNVWIRLCLIVACVGWLHRPAEAAQDNLPSAETAAAALPGQRGDEAFMAEVAQNTHIAVLASQLAVSRCRHADVCAYADVMVREHRKIRSALNALARNKQVPLPSEPSPTQWTELSILESDSRKFDGHYARVFGLQAQERNIRLFEHAAQEAQDADVRAFAKNALPAMQQHLKVWTSLSAGRAY